MSLEDAIAEAQDEFDSSTNWYEYHEFVLKLIKTIYKEQKDK